MQEVGHCDLGQADVQAHELVAGQVQQHRVAAGGHAQATAAVDVADAGVHRHGTHQRAQRCLATAVVGHLHIAAQQLEHVAQAVHAQLVGVHHQ